MPCWLQLALWHWAAQVHRRPWGTPPRPPPNVPALILAALAEVGPECIDLSGRGIRSNHLQGVVFPAVRNIRLTNNSIEILESINFPQALCFLNLERNLVVNLPLQLNVLLSNLEYLHLNNNRISSLEAVVFPPRLKVLNLNFNEILSLQNGTLPGKLEKLSMTDNAITTLDNVDFPTTLQELSLSNQNLQVQDHSRNRIASLQGARLRACSALHTLDLSCNEIESFPQGAPGAFPDSLSDLRLNGNRITHLQGCVLPPSMRRLWLERNLIDNLQGYAFPPQLTFLALAHNPIALADNANAIGILAPPGCSVFI